MPNFSNWLPRYSAISFSSPVMLTISATWRASSTILSRSTCSRTCSSIRAPLGRCDFALNFFCSTLAPRCQQTLLTLIADLLKLGLHEGRFGHRRGFGGFHLAFFAVHGTIRGQWSDRPGIHHGPEFLGSSFLIE